MRGTHGHRHILSIKNVADRGDILWKMIIDIHLDCKGQFMRRAVDPKVLSKIKKNESREINVPRALLKG